MRIRALLTLFLLALNLMTSLRAEVVRVEVRSRSPFRDGIEFGAAGAYESLSGIVHYAVDPLHERNRGIVDLDRAPRRSDGRVEFSADFQILRPADPRRGNGALLYDVNNRGNRLALGFFHGVGEKGDPPQFFLMHSGFTVVWCGWIGELLPGNDRLLLRAPIATAEGGEPIVGPARFEIVTDNPAETMPLSRRDGHGSYAPTARGDAEGRLTWRLREGDPRIPIPRAQWSLEKLAVPDAGGSVAGTLGQIRLRLAEGFEPGYLYELIYEAQGPIVQGLGYAAVRDLVSHLRRGGAEGPAIPRAIGFGVSQSGRFLRNFLHLGFNFDEGGRKVFDALMPHVAGGGLGFFNHRFAQPTRHNAQHEEHLYPADRFPFTYGESVDPYGGRIDSVLPRHLSAESLPFVFHTQSAAEYWHRSGSLVHTDPLGRRDAAIPERVRVYAFGGTQHGPAGNPPSRGIAQNLHNPGDYRPVLRALLAALDAWVKDGTAPPPSVYPRIDGGTLIEPSRYVSEFPAIPGVRPPEAIQRPPASDFGPEFHSKGIISIEPPRVTGAYGVLVPRPDRLGNDTGTLLVPDVAVPVATYTGWNLRTRTAGAENQLVSLVGSYIPLARTRTEREASGDPRPSVEELYGSYEEYLKRYRAACETLVARKFLLEADAEKLIRSREEMQSLFAAR